MSNPKDVQVEINNYNAEESMNVKNQNAKSLESFSHNNSDNDDFENAIHAIQINDDVEEEEDVNEHICDHTDDIIGKMSQKELIMCKNGIIDLRTGKLIKCDNYSLNSMKNVQMLNMHYISEENLQQKMKDKIYNIVRTFFPNEKTMRMVMEFLWIALTNHQLGVLHFHVGSSANGKSMFLGAIDHLWGDYAEHVDDDLLSTVNSDAKTTLARTIGKRLIICDGFSKIISASKIKTMLGKETILRRRIYGEKKCLRNSKIIVVSNTLPKIDHADMAVYDRIQFIPWFHLLNDVRVRHQHHFDTFYAFKTKEFQILGPYLFHLIMHYGKAVIQRMDQGLTMCPVSSNESMALQQQFLSQIISENVEEENEQETTSSMNID